MSILFMGPEERESLRTLKEYAEANPISLDDLLDQMNGERKPVGSMQEYTRHIPVNYKVVFSIEEQPKADIRHCSVSCNGNTPSIEAMEWILKELGYRYDFQSGQSKVYTEDLGNGGKAINVMEIIKMVDQ